MRSRRRTSGMVALTIGALALAGCGGSGVSPSPSVSAGATTVDVTVGEFAVGTSVSSAPAGDVSFAVTNTGPEDVHELVVIKTDISFIALPTDANGAVDEAVGGMEVKGEVEDIPVGTSQELTLTLEPGTYALICNIWDETEKEAHYAEGMRTEFTVTD